ncbi:hypothetical protein BHM03_00058434 [Ensete ventricosum]|nr:hypothetical protein BHM03_00058434 [Ensete ventricosum]
MARAACKGDNREGNAYGHNAHRQAAYGLDGRARQRPPTRAIVGGAALHNGDGGDSLEEGSKGYSFEREGVSGTHDAVVGDRDVW